MRVLVFGTFDGLHEGHLQMLKQAQIQGQVNVCLAPDSVVERLKGRLPIKDYEARRKALLDSKLVTAVTPSDAIDGHYDSVRQMKPDLIAFGYDQTLLRENFLNWQQVTHDETPHLVLQPYKPDIYKSSFLRPNDA